MGGLLYAASGRSLSAVVGASDVGIEMSGASAAGAKGGEGSGRPGAAEGRGGASPGEKRAKPRKRFKPPALEEPRPTTLLIEEAELRFKLLQLFHAWDTNNDQVLTLLEIILGLRMQGFSLSPETLRDVIDSVADPAKDKYTSHKSEAHGHHFLDNESFVEVFLHAELLGRLTTADAIRAVDLMRETVVSNPEFVTLHDAVCAP